MSTPTAAPWFVDDRRPKGGELQIQAQHRGDGSSYCVASVNRHEAPEANARLIAAAPDLLALLERVSAIYGENSKRMAPMMAGHDQMEPLMVEVSAALAKAKA